MRLLLLIASSAFLLNYCSGESWDAIVYPDENDLLDYIRIGSYESLESCRSAALERLAEISSIHSGDWECGLNCEPYKPGSDLMVCEETER